MLSTPKLRNEFRFDRRLIINLKINNNHEIKTLPVNLINTIFFQL